VKRPGDPCGLWVEQGEAGQGKDAGGGTAFSVAAWLAVAKDTCVLR